MKSLAIFASGPSLHAAGIERLRGAEGLHLLTINSPHPAIPLDEYHYWAMTDSLIAERHMAQLFQYPGTIITPLKLPTARHIQEYKLLRGMGFSRNICEGYYVGSSTLYVCLQWAIEKQYDRIYVFGCDLDPTDGRRWHNYEEPHNSPELRARRFEGEALFLRYAASQMTDEERESVVFCSSAKGWEFLKSFTCLPPGEAVGHVLSSLGE